MSKVLPSKTPVTIDKEEAMAFEMIELTCDELSTLTRAFEVIEQVCRELQQDSKEELLPVEEQVH